MDKIVKAIVKAFKGGNKLIIFGCGGSSAEASHFAAEFLGKGYPAISLTDASIITAIGNDYSFDEVYSRQIFALGQEGDICIGFSTSGTSPSVVKGLKEAKRLGFTAIDWPRNKSKKSDKDTARIQEYQLNLLHEVYLKVINKL